MRWLPTSASRFRLAETPETIGGQRTRHLGLEQRQLVSHDAGAADRSGGATGAAKRDLMGRMLPRSRRRPREDQALEWRPGPAWRSHSPATSARDPAGRADLIGAADRSRARVAQHDAYCEALSRLGLWVLRLPADTACPDCCFVEDTAVVVDELAVMAAPTPVSRRPEVPGGRQRAGARSASSPTCRRTRTWRAATSCSSAGCSTWASPPGPTRRASWRSRTPSSPSGYRVVPVPVSGCLHLKSAVTAIGDEAVIANPDWIDTDVFADVAVLPVHAQEPFAANVLRARRAHRGRGPSAHAGPARPLRLRGAAARHVGVREGGGGRHLQEHRVPRSEGLGRQRRERRRPATSTPTSTSAFVMTELGSRRGEPIESDGLLEPPWAALSPPFATNFQPRPRGRGRGRAHGRARP